MGFNFVLWNKFHFFHQWNHRCLTGFSYTLSVYLLNVKLIRSSRTLVNYRRQAHHRWPTSYYVYCSRRYNYLAKSPVLCTTAGAVGKTFHLVVPYQPSLWMVYLTLTIWLSANTLSIVETFPLKLHSIHNVYVYIAKSNEQRAQPRQSKINW